MQRLHPLINAIIILFFTLTQGIVHASSIPTPRAPIVYEFLPGQSLTIASSNTKELRFWCEMHVNTLAVNVLFIKQITGTSEINGNSLSTGNTMDLSIVQLQTLQIISSKNSKTQFTNTGTWTIIANCY